MRAFYQFNGGEFLACYQKRSSAETTVAMIKQKVGARVRPKSATAQVSEVLCKVVAHYICVLVQSIYELGLEPVFRNGRAGASEATCDARRVLRLSSAACFNLLPSGALDCAWWVRALPSNRA